MNTINVNLKPCTCHFREADQRGNDHPYPCPAAPIPLPCPIQRTVEMTVRLGECRGFSTITARGCSGSWTSPSPSGPVHHEHEVDCPARPIRVTCTIGGETWAGSTVVDVDNPDDHQGRWGAGSGDTYRSAIAACRARWEIIVALVTGKRQTDGGWIDAPTDLFTQRDAVFAAIAKMATLEHEHEAARLILPASCRPIPATGSDTPHPSADALRLYVSHLIAKVGAL